MKQTQVEAQCVFCKKTRLIKAGEVPKGDMPMCAGCGGPMVAVKAVRK